MSKTVHLEVTVTLDTKEELDEFVDKLADFVADPWGGAVGYRDWDFQPTSIFTGYGTTENTIIVPPLQWKEARPFECNAKHLHADEHTDTCGFSK